MPVNPDQSASTHRSPLKTHIPPLLILGVSLLGLATPAAQGEVTARFDSFLKTRGDYTYQQPVFAVNNGPLRIDFFPTTFWTIGRIFYHDAMVGQPTGGTGTVVHWDGEAVGTVHRSEKGQEQLISAVLEVDGKPHDLLTASKEDTWSGQNMTLIKTSRVGPFLHRATFILRDGADTLIIRHDYRAEVEITAERFQGYCYVFMHMMPESFLAWMRLDAQTPSMLKDTIETGGKPKTLWTEDIQGLACYSPTEKLGVVYAFPEGQHGLSHLVYRSGKDVKYRAILFDQEGYPAGTELSWSELLTPFQSPADHWEKVAEGILRHDIAMQAPNVPPLPKQL